MQMKWLNEFKNAYNGWSRSTQLIAMGVGLLLLFSTGLFPVFALVGAVWIGKNWWDNRQAQKSPGLLNGNLTPQVPPVSPPPPTATPPVTQPTQTQVPPPTPPQMPLPPQPNRPNIDWNKP
jgi:hypothetical protein